MHIKYLESQKDWVTDKLMYWYAVGGNTYYGILKLSRGFVLYYRENGKAQPAICTSVTAEILNVLIEDLRKNGYYS